MAVSNVEYSCLQINLHKSLVAMGALCADLKTLGSKKIILFLTEPYVGRTRVGLPQVLMTFEAFTPEIKTGEE